MEIESQVKRIREHLEGGNSITAIEALNMFGCFRLTSRIHDLKRMGMAIKTTTIIKGNKHYAQYQLITNSKN